LLNCDEHRLDAQRMNQLLKPLKSIAINQISFIPADVDYDRTDIDYCPAHIDYDRADIDYDLVNIN
jgi:hypothetical protein